MSARGRIDELMVDRGLSESRERAQALLLAGRVFVRGQRVDKAGTLIDRALQIEVRGDECPYVSRGGLKLAGVMTPLQITPTGLICADIGASTGGFTDVLLQSGALRVYAVDVGRGQLHQKLRLDPRVIVHEGINARFPLGEIIPEPIQLCVMDVSFISLTKILGAVTAVLSREPSSSVVAMVKPQFELPPREVGKGGVVRDDALRAKAVESVVSYAREIGLVEVGRCDSPVHGPAGNREIFVKFALG